MIIEIGKSIYILNVDTIAPAVKQSRVSAYYASLADCCIN
jgi:hypothetical protein